MCLAPMPQAWVDAFQALNTTPPAGLDFGLTAQGSAGGTVFGQYITSSDIGLGSLDLHSGSLTRLSSFGRDSGGLAWISTELPWIIWRQQDSNLQPGWTMIALNITTRERITLAADDPAPGHIVIQGQTPYPVIRNGIVAWSQPVQSSTGKPQSKVVQYNLATRSSSELQSGIVSAPVFAGPYLMWASEDSDNGYSFQAVAADTMQAVRLDKGLPIPDSVQYLAGGEDYVAWTSSSLSDLFVFRFSSHRTYHYITPPDLLHRVQFPVLVGDYAVWYTGDRFTVMDLTTGGAFDVYGSATAGNGGIAIAQQTGPVVKGQIGQSRVSSLSVGEVPHLGSCP